MYIYICFFGGDAARLPYNGKQISTKPIDEADLNKTAYAEKKNVKYTGEVTITNENHNHQVTVS